MVRRFKWRLTNLGLGFVIACTPGEGDGDGDGTQTGPTATSPTGDPSDTNDPSDGSGGGSVTSGEASDDESGGPTSGDDDPTTGGDDDPTTTGEDPTTGGEPEEVRFVGNITTNGMVRPDFVDYWNQITPENEGKWGSVEGTRDVMNWAPLDAVHDYAVMHGIPFKQHVMVWGSQQPGWIGGLPPGEQLAEVEEWIQEFCARYPDTQLIDVVNEPPPHTTPSYMNAIGGPGASGYDWIIWSFETTRQYCPNATLIINDYNVLRWNTANFVNIVNAVKNSGYVDAMGAQAHGLESLSLPELEANLQTVLSTGLPLYISEYDIDEANDNQQRAIMEEQFTLFWETEEIVGITLWGYVYGATWMPNTGLLVGDQPRPALTWLMDYLANQ